jgi:predicted transcriptional regulator of viral defense system
MNPEVHAVTREEEILLENAVQQEEIVINEIASRYLLNEQQILTASSHLVEQGFLEEARPGAYRATDAGRAAWNSILRSERAEVVQRTGTWGRPT